MSNDFRVSARTAEFQKECFIFNASLILASPYLVSTRNKESIDQDELRG